MSDCCNVPESEAVVDERCHRCGERGRRVPRITLQSLLVEEARALLVEEPYYFDRSPNCDVVYFSNEAGSYFDKRDLVVRVGLKESEAPIPLCYCFGHTVGSVSDEILSTGRSGIAETIRAEVRAGNCSCETKNPSGQCCLGEVHQTIRRVEKELEEAEKMI